MKIAVTGSKGQLGSVLTNLLSSHGHHVIGLDLPEFDLTDAVLAIQRLDEIRPDVVFHCAAFTNVDACESDPQTAYAVNVQGTKTLVQGLSAHSGRVVYISTDYVFDGESNEGYSELDIPNPISVYGQSKLRGEQIVLAANPSNVVARISWLFGPGGFGNFVKAIHERALSGQPLKIVDDQRGIPTYAPFLAETLLDIAEQACGGIVHVPGGCESVTWYQFGVELLKRAGLEDSVSVQACTTAEFPRPAPRPKNSTLLSYARTAMGLKPQQDWRAGLDHYFKSL